MNRKFISKSNYTLRKVLNTKENMQIVKDFIEAILKVEIAKIELKPYLISKEKSLPSEENFGICDVRVKLKNEEELNVGIQIVDGCYYIQSKLLLYYAQIHDNQLEYEEYDDVAKTITINILDFNYFSSKDYHKKIIINGKDNKFGFVEDVELHVLELNKFKNKANQYLMSEEEEWMTYLVGENKSAIKYILKENRNIKKLDEILEKYWREEKMK